MANTATAAENYRKALIRRREGGGISVRGLTYASGDMNMTDCITNGFWRINCKQLVGIATTTEAGLSPDRYPIRFIIGPAPNVRRAAVMSAGYWSIVNAAGEGIIFSKRGLGSDTTLRNLKAHVSDFDAVMWEVYREVGSDTTAPTAAHIASFDSMYALISVPNPTPDQAAAIQAKFTEITDVCRIAKVHPRFKVTDTLYLAGWPVGDRAGSEDERNRKLALESMLNVMVNASRLEERTTGCDAGVYTLAAYTIAAMFRYGMNEVYSNNESHTVYVNPAADGTYIFTISAIVSPAGSTGPADLAVAQQIDITTVRMSRKMTELAPGIAVIAGINHYMLNHTTGGPIASGSLLTFLAMSDVITSTMDRTAQERITTVFYEALHPVNKRAVANLFIKESLVYTHGKDPGARAYEELDLDSFTRIRGKANPAGSHKAVICASVLARVIDSGLSPLLPWAEEITNCIAECREVMTIGARAHIGSDYYTGMSSRTQSAVLDKYLPELAAFIANLAKGDSLSFSPHLSLTIAAAADTKWVALCKALKASDVSAVTVDTVRKYLLSVGKSFSTFKPDDETTWGQVIQESQVARAAIREFL